MKRLMEKMVFCALMMAWLRATRPTRRSWFLLTATTDGTSRSPSADEITTGSPACITATTELVVPRSMPMTFPIDFLLASHPDQGWAQDPVTDQVAWLNDFDNLAAFVVRAILV